MATVKKKTTKVIKKKIGKNYLSTPIKTNRSKVVTTKAKTSSNSLLGALVQEDNKTLTENGAATYKSTLNSVLDFFAMGAALRNRSESDVISLFTKAFAEDQLLAGKALFNVRNIRGGAGERETFKRIIKYLGNNYADFVKKNIANIPFFGRFDDLFALFDTKSEKDMIAFIENQLNDDVASYEEDKPISLLAKWLPSENATSKKTRALGQRIRKALRYTSPQYRHTLTELRAYLKIVETKMSNGEWSEIDYSTVPSKASLNYRKAFARNDSERYTQFIADVKSGNVKVNSSTLFPYEIVGKILDRYDTSETLDVLWDNLPNYLEDNDRNILTVCDVSGSMMGNPMNVSISLGIYTAERNKGPFANHFITYSEKPTLQKVIGANIREKIRNMQQIAAYSTNLQAVFSMVLDTAVKNKISQKDMPEQILIITDVEFNSTQNGNTNLEEIRAKYKAAGYQCPSLVFWNVNSRQNNVPATANEKGVLLVSGCSPSVFKTLLSGKNYTPVDQMLETLNQEIYNRIII